MHVSKQTALDPAAVQNWHIIGIQGSPTITKILSFCTIHIHKVIDI